MTGLSTTGSRVSRVATAIKRLFAPVRQGKERGSNLIEMAMIATILMTLAAGAIDLGGAYQNYIILLNASREGARQYSRMPCKFDNRTGLKNAITASAIQEVEESNMEDLISASNIQLSPDPVSSTCPDAGDPINVTVEYRYPTSIARMIGIDEIPLRAMTSMVHFGEESSGSSEH